MRLRCWKVRLSFPLLLKDFTPKSFAEHKRAPKSQLWGMSWKRDFPGLCGTTWLGSHGRGGRACGSAGWDDGLGMPEFWSRIWRTSLYFGFKQLLNKIHINIPGWRLSTSQRPSYSQPRTGFNSFLFLCCRLNPVSPLHFLQVTWPSYISSLYLLSERIPLLLISLNLPVLSFMYYQPLF